MKKVYFILIALVFQQLVSAQALMQRKADQLYNELAYASAAEYYKDLTKDKYASETNLRKLSDCYFKIYDFKNAETFYKKLVEKYPSTVTETDLINYLQVLKYNEKYSEAKKALDLLEQKRKDNLISKNHHDHQNYFQELKEDSSSYRITDLDALNTEYSEFSPVQLNKSKQFIFASNRRNTSARNKTFAWDDSYFIDVYSSIKKDSIHFEEIRTINKDVTTLYHDGPVSFSPDENTLYLTRSNVIKRKVEKGTVNVVNLKLYIIKKDKDGKLSAPENFPYNSDDYSLGHATITSDGKRMYFVSDMPGGYGQTDLYYSEFVNGKWEKPVNLGPAINTEGREMFPYVYEDGTLFFSTDGRAGLGGLDLYFTVPSIDMYYEPQSLGYPLNSHFDDFGLSLNHDLRSGYISSNRENGKGKDDIYYFISKDPIIGVTLSGTVYDELTMSVIPNSKVYLLDANKKIIDSTKANDKGFYTFKISDPSKKYFLTANGGPKYYERTIPVKELKAGENKQDIDLYPKYKLICTVTDLKTGKPIEGVKAVFTDNSTKATKDYKTNNEGIFSDQIKDKKPDDLVDLWVKFEKEGYITVERNFKVTLGENTIIELKEKLQKLEIGTDIAKVVEVNPIYFDLAKWNIRPDAAKELDKIVKAMLANPTMVIELGSHTDCRSSAAYNMTLSDKRAKSSAAYIISKGIAKERIYGKGYGESKLINKCECEGKKVVPCSEDEHQANRRTEFIIVKF